MWPFPFWRRGMPPQEYQRGIMRRYQREGDGWSAHLQSTRGAVLRFADRVRAEELAVLGSGWLLDLPVTELLELGVELHLYDVAHPPQVVAQYSSVARVHFHTVDITGGLLRALARGSHAHALLERMRMRAYHPSVLELPSQRPIVSLNLLSQLGYPLLEAGWLRLSDEEYEELVSALQSIHLDWLSHFSAALVISDVREERYALREGIYLGSVPTLLVPLPVLEERSNWVWAFDSTGAYLPDMRIDLAVEAGMLAGAI